MNEYKETFATNHAVCDKLGITPTRLHAYYDPETDLYVIWSNGAVLYTHNDIHEHQRFLNSLWSRYKLSVVEIQNNIFTP